VEHTVAAAGGRSELTILEKYGVTINDPTLTERSVPALRWAAHDAVTTAPLKTGSEDFSFMANEVPGLFFFLGTTPKGQDPNAAPPNHNPGFTIDESTLNVGVRALAALATDFLSSQAAVGPALSRP
jgi:metal-dependent amidase/aminoacylase/carboxypeptidase family protein